MKDGKFGTNCPWETNEVEWEKNHNKITVKAKRKLSEFENIYSENKIRIYGYYSVENTSGSGTILD